MQRLSTSEFIFIAIRASLPASLAAIVRSISSMIPSRMCAGASSTWREPPGRAKPVSWLNMSATSAPIYSSQVKRPKSVYRRAVVGW